MAVCVCGCVFILYTRMWVCVCVKLCGLFLSTASIMTLPLYANSPHGWTKKCQSSRDRPPFTLRGALTQVVLFVRAVVEYKTRHGWALLHTDDCFKPPAISHIEFFTMFVCAESLSWQLKKNKKQKEQPEVLNRE